jgi:hypothetical protein
MNRGAGSESQKLTISSPARAVREAHNRRDADDLCYSLVAAASAICLKTGGHHMSGGKHGAEFGTSTRKSAGHRSRVHLAGGDLTAAPAMGKRSV